MNQRPRWPGWRREAGHGGIVPRGWRLAWYEPRRRVGVYYPPLLHWMARAWRELAHRARLALRAPALERAEFFEMQAAQRQRQLLAEEYARGYLVGWSECFEVCLEAVEQEFSNDDALWRIGGIAGDAKNPPRKN